MEIRTFENRDEAAVVALWEACGLTVPWNNPASDIRRCIEGDSSTLLVGLIDGAVVSTAMVGDDGHRGWIYYVAVAPERQGTGLGREIITAAEAWLKARGAPKVLLMIRESNDRVASFYTGLGYEETPRIVMAKWLDR